MRNNISSLGTTELNITDTQLRAILYNPKRFINTKLTAYETRCKYITYSEFSKYCKLHNFEKVVIEIDPDSAFALTITKYIDNENYASSIYGINGKRLAKFKCINKK